MSYCLDAVGGQTSATITISGTGGGTWAASVLEYTSSTGSIALNTGATPSASGTNTTCTTCAGKALTLSGANAVIVQINSPTNTATAINGSYTDPANFPGSGFFGQAGWINTTSTSPTTPNWTTTSGVDAVSAIAFEEAAAGGGTTNPGWTGWF